MLWFFYSLLSLTALPQYTSSSCNETFRKNLSESELFEYLTDECRYKKLEVPKIEKNEPLYVRVKTYVYHFKASTSQSLVSKVHKAHKKFIFSSKNMEILLLVEMSWPDQRLRYKDLDTNISLLIGEKALLDSIWIPSAFFANERESNVMGSLRKDDLITILPDGLVMFTSRQKTSVNCHLQLEKFPFDKQTCKLIMDNWRHNTSEVRLIWDELSPTALHWGEVCLAEFSLLDVYTYSTYDLYQTENNVYNYSSLVLTFELGREYGFYLMDYYLPSILLVILSWMTFWLTPDCVPARVSLGTSTILTFLLLSWTGNAVPRASHFKVNDIWELACTAFIFLSLTEFAFVNTIDRRKKENITLKKPTSKYILKYSVSATPKRPNRMLRRSSSCPSSPEIRRHFLRAYNEPKCKVVEELKAADFGRQVAEKLQTIKLQMDEEDNNVMTPQKIAKWIDEKSRFVFPIFFLLFNIVYWSFILF